MGIFGIKINISVFKLIILSTLIAIVILGYFVWAANGELNPKKFSILSGLLTGFIVGLFQLLLSWYEHRKIQKFEEMRIIDVMKHRDNRTFYQDLIEKSKSEISVMGVTASRFVEHFAATESTRAESKVLLLAMTRGVKVKLLLPKSEFLQGDDKREAENKVKTAFEKIKAENSTNFEFKYFNHLPTHSIFIIDDQCILGPVFPNVSSKDTPAIHSYSDSPFAKEYLKHFNDEWQNAK